MAPQVCVFGGDGAAPEAMKPSVGVLDRLAPDVEFVEPAVESHAAALADGRLPDELRAAIDEADAVLFGATDGGHAGVFRYLRRTYGGGLPANVRPVRSLDGARSPLAEPTGIDYVLVRDNLEGAYVGGEGDLAALLDSGLDLDDVTLELSELGPGGYGLRVTSERTARWLGEFACQLATERSDDPLVTCATKSNVFPRTDGRLERAVESAADRHGVAFEHRHADDVGQALVLEPGRFDVVVTPNLAGDLLSEVGAGTVGGVGLAPSGCYGEDAAYFEPVHGSAPDIAGDGVVNPTATLLSGAMLLRYLGREDDADRLVAAVEGVYADGGPLTPDQGGEASTEEMAAAVGRRLGQ